MVALSNSSEGQFQYLKVFSSALSFLLSCCIAFLALETAPNEESLQFLAEEQISCSVTGCPQFPEAPKEESATATSPHVRTSQHSLNLTHSSIWREGTPREPRPGFHYSSIEFSFSSSSSGSSGWLLCGSGQCFLLYLQGFLLLLVIYRISLW